MNFRKIKLSCSGLCGVPRLNQIGNVIKVSSLCELVGCVSEIGVCSQLLALYYPCTFLE